MLIKSTQVKPTQVKHASEYYAKFDPNGNLSEESLVQFEKNGFLTFSPDVLGINHIDAFRDNANALLPNWDDGRVTDENYEQEKDKFINSFKQNNVGYWGSPLVHRFNRGKGNVDRTKNTNWLLGKRATLSAQYWPKEMVSHIENQTILALSRQLLDAKELSFHNGSVARSFYGTVGESKQLHVDMSGFTRKPLEAVDKQHFVLNMFTYCDDVTEDLSPIRVVPGSHSRYKEINEYIAKSSLVDKNTHVLNRDLPIYEELLPDYLSAPIKIIGEKGTLIAFRCDLLHGATNNSVTEKSRLVAVCNYSNREHKEFYQSHPRSESKLRSAFSMCFDDVGLVETTFLDKSKDLVVMRLRAMASNILRYFRKPKLFYIRVIQKLIKTRIELGYKIFRHSKREYLNLGAGCNWNHPLFISTDQASGVSETLDLSLKIPLPFPDESFRAIYTSHFFEHLKLSQVKYLFLQVYRCIKKDGVFRIAVPDLGGWMDAYENKNRMYFSYNLSGPAYQQDSWLRLITRQFADPVLDKNYSDEELYELYEKMSGEDFLNFLEDEVEKFDDPLLLAPHAHKTWFNKNKLESLLKDAGFNNIRHVDEKTSQESVFLDLPQMFDMVKPGRNEGTLFMEATK